MGFRKRITSGQGFTIIELLAVVLILGILMAIALPAYFSAIADSQSKACRDNLMAIANAERSRYVRNRTYSPPLAAGAMTQAWVTANLPDLQTTPICPTGGRYSVTFSDGTKKSNGLTVPSGVPIVACTKDGTFALNVDAR